ncbi:MULTISPECIES: anti-sigma factor [unclassified Streptomyces]|uniref:anti-sigma factor n=1 Tax=unclassified Streptomyces TaxID=2593676 RepID=UPI0005EC7A4F|nr:MULTISPECIES: anti-sigma factor [unclassified Streptomyces]APU43850.1 anti-sigma factor [Streptomyces sp. TN58]KJK44310.1 anti-sigma-K factor RskA [Streptomyces sp. NRRL F-4428]
MKQHHSDVHTLAAAYALNALDPAERKAFTDHLPHCQACRDEVAEFEATAARLADAAAEYPPTALKHHVMAAVDGVRQLPPRVPHTAPSVTVGSALRRRAVPLALAASVVAAASFAGLAAWQNQHIEQHRQRAAQAEQRLDDVSTVLAAPDARAAHGRASNGAATTVVASKRQNRAVFTAAGLPAPAPGTTYQLWLDHDGTMRPAGFIRQDGTVLVDGDTAGAGALGLTVEPAGGSRRPTSAPLLLITLPT